MRQIGLLLVVVIGAAACSSTMDPTEGQVEKDLVGSWGEQPSSDSVQRLLTIAVKDTVLSGTGNWATVMRTGVLSFTGFVSDSAVVIHITQDDNEQVTYEARLQTSRVLTGSISGDGDPVSVEFDKLQTDPP